MDENARKRKRDDGDAGSESSDDELGSELPKEGLNRGDARSKKQKQPGNGEKSENEAAKSKEAEDRKKLKEDKKAQKKATQKEKKKAKEAARKEKLNGEKNKAADGQPQPQKEPKSQNEVKSQKEAKGAEPDNTKPAENQSSESGGEDGTDEEGDGEGISLKFDPDQEQPSSNSSTPNSPGFDTSTGLSGSSSISSIVPPTASETSDKTAQQKPLKSTPEELKQRLQKRLDELRAARHADGLNGKPARNRQELIEARRQKAEQRKAHKKELRQKAKEEEQRVKDDAMARRFSPGGSGSLLASPRSPADSIGSGNNFSFGRMVFTDGGHTDATLSNIREQPTRQGPQDAATALKAAESKQARLAGMDSEKRAGVEQKDMWLNAKKRAHGERVRDDTSLLKKALKRKESAKKRSEREWKGRLDTIKKGQETRQSKREENLRKRREEKGNKGKKAGGAKKKARPGFEGSFKTKVGGKK